MNIPTKLVLFTSKSGNLARYISVHFSEFNPIFIHPDDDLEVVFHTLIDHSKQQKLFGLSAGYTKLIPKNIIEIFQGLLYNTHPGSLPLTRGLYGMDVIRRMINTYQLLGYVTIHQIDEHYDTGKIIKAVGFPYLRGVADVGLLYKCLCDNSTISKDYLIEWSNNYQQMLKLVEPTIIVKFIQTQI